MSARHLHETVAIPTIMDGLLYGDDGAVAAWIYARLSTTPRAAPPDTVAIGMLGAGTLSDTIIAGIAIVRTHTMADGAQDLEIAVAVDQFGLALGHQFRAGFRHLFETMGAARLSARVSASNEPCLHLAYWLGFRPEGRCSHPTDRAYDDVILGLTPDRCRFKWRTD